MKCRAFAYVYMYIRHYPHHYLMADYQHVTTNIMIGVFLEYCRQNNIHIQGNVVPVDYTPSSESDGRALYNTTTKGDILLTPETFNMKKRDAVRLELVGHCNTSEFSPVRSELHPIIRTLNANGSTVDFFYVQNRKHMEKILPDILPLKGSAPTDNPSAAQLKTSDMSANTTSDGQPSEITGLLHHIIVLLHRIDQNTST